MTHRPLRAVPDPDDFSDLYEKLPSAAAPTTAGTWKPQEDGPGAEIKGRVVAAEEIGGDWGPKPVLTIDTSAGQYKVWASHAVLRGELETQPPAPGSRIIIRYEGTATSSAGHEYHVYSLAVDRTLAVPPGAKWLDVFNQRVSIPETTAPRDDLPF